MASNITYASALTTIIEFAAENGFDNQDVMDKLITLRDQKATTKKGRKSDAREENERLAQEVANAMQHQNLTEIRATWVRDNIVGVNTVPKATAVLAVAVDMGLLNKIVVNKSATRNELVYVIPTE
jgi:hypothetical protein